MDPRPHSVATALAASELESLREQSTKQWEASQYLRSLLTLEHACALVAAYDISEEGGHDYLIKVRVRDLFDTDTYGVLAEILENSPYFPQASAWVVEWAQEYVSSEALPPAQVERLREVDQRSARLASRIADILRTKEGSGDGRRKDEASK